MTDLGQTTNTTSNQTNGYYDPHPGSKTFGDETTYSTNTLESAVTVTTPNQ